MSPNRLRRQRIAMRLPDLSGLSGLVGIGNEMDGSREKTGRTKM